mgnify:CR=1 FL=1
MHLIWICLAILLSGCSCDHLSVHTAYVNKQSLASYHVGTPDPCLNNPPIGERLIISWLLPKGYMQYQDLHLEIVIHLENKEKICRIFPIYKVSGTYVYSILNEEFFDKGGILTYKVDLVGDQKVLTTWRHQLWTELIILNP